MKTRMNYFQQSSGLAKNLIQFGQLIAKGAIPAEILHLVNIRASQMNGCAFCVDLHVKQAKIQGERELRLYHIPIWRESTLFSSRERAALEWTEAVTRIAEAPGISDEIYGRVSHEFSDQELSDLTFAIANINMWNRLNVASRSVPGTLDEMLGVAKSGLK